MPRWRFGLTSGNTSLLYDWFAAEALQDLMIVIAEISPLTKSAESSILSFEILHGLARQG